MPPQRARRGQKATGCAARARCREQQRETLRLSPHPPLHPAGHGGTQFPKPSRKNYSCTAKLADTLLFNKVRRGTNRRKGRQQEGAAELRRLPAHDGDGRLQEQGDRKGQDRNRARQGSRGDDRQRFAGMRASYAACCASGARETPCACALSTPGATHGRAACAVWHMCTRRDVVCHRAGRVRFRLWREPRRARALRLKLRARDAARR